MWHLPLCLVQALKFDVKSEACVFRDRQTLSEQRLLYCSVSLTGFPTLLIFGLLLLWSVVRPSLPLKRFSKYLSGIFSCFHQDCWSELLVHYKTLLILHYMSFLSKNYFWYLYLVCSHIYSNLDLDLEDLSSEQVTFPILNLAI